MRVISSVVYLTALSLGLVFATSVLASEETQLIDSINAYRGQLHQCGGQVSHELPPLTSDPRLVLSAGNIGDLQQALARATYPMVNVQAISLSGPRDAQAAMKAVEETFCQVVLDPQFVDIGVSREDREWRIVLARPMLTARLGDGQGEGQKMLAMINGARATPHNCGPESFSAAAPMTWNAILASAAEAHSRDMANHNYFDHTDSDGHTPGDRAELAGYGGTQVDENIAAGQDSTRKVVEGWLSSPEQCANLMNPLINELGAAYATDPKSDAGIYWTVMFGAK